ncbi:hypothetical protein G4V62_16885 [Bacillaceae bacterium SIJ1]|uniref:hypothetical protein n=1 Tax=Litoribacterium kuwaitense TaxID=1398745 RepID=UPI0013EBA28A|nr:hypothetical protein [Litoribacterium kuwaitense]NGP46541.1 hypothetical protein [Litoribacterium kuwaitense]
MFRSIARRFGGFILLYIGLAILFGSVGYGQMLLGPIFLAGFGWSLYEPASLWLRWSAYFFYGLALIICTTLFFPPTFVGILIAGLFIFFGACLLLGRSPETFFKPPHQHREDDILEALSNEDFSK